MSQPVVRICVSPILYPLYKEENSITVVVDILRATSAICTALHHGMKGVIPISKIEEADVFAGDDYIHAAERGGEIVGGFEYGNSPLSYINNPETIGKTLVLTTTNGTQAIEAAKNDGPLCIGSFNNISFLSDWLSLQQKDVMILCAGWKNRINLEDTLFAGALSHRLLNRGFDMDIDSDAVIMAGSVYQSARDNLMEFLEKSSHRNRLKKLNLEEDVQYCMTKDTTAVVPFLQGNTLVNII